MRAGRDAFVEREMYDGRYIPVSFDTIPKDEVTLEKAFWPTKKTKREKERERGTSHTSIR
jgi:hypothetical protein